MPDTVRIVVEVDVGPYDFGAGETPEQAALDIALRNATHDDPGVRVIDVELLA
jgi:hypothetical protein